MISDDFIARMKHSPIRNYAGVPGLTSWLLGGRSKDAGCIRLFECERNHFEAITPHSHRFDFECVVLQGSVRNVLFEKVPTDISGDFYAATELKYGGECGTYELGDQASGFYRATESRFSQGERYSMKAHQVHNIYFSKGSRVLFFEGPQASESSLILEPYSNGEHIKTFKVEPWMFKKDSE